MFPAFPLFPHSSAHLFPISLTVALRYHLFPVLPLLPAMPTACSWFCSWPQPALCCALSVLTGWDLLKPSKHLIAFVCLLLSHHVESTSPYAEILQGCWSHLILAWTSWSNTHGMNVKKKKNKRFVWGKQLVCCLQGVGSKGLILLSSYLDVCMYIMHTQVLFRDHTQSVMIEVETGSLRTHK